MTGESAFTAEFFAAHAATPYRRFAEPHNFFAAVGEVAGRSVLDLACGLGIYTRALRARGAAPVLGVDIDQALIEEARAFERENPLGIEYRVADVTSLQVDQRSDIATGVHVLQFARTERELAGMCSAVLGSLKPGGRFVTVVPNSEFDSERSDLTKYGLTVQMPAAREDGETIRIHVHTEPPATFENVFWDRETYCRSLAEAGFGAVTWRAMGAPPISEEFDEGFWEDFAANPPVAVITCAKPSR